MSFSSPLSSSFSSADVFWLIFDIFIDDFRCH
jgi:hypothetical protein